jgi:hypothetical protein
LEEKFEIDKLSYLYLSPVRYLEDLERVSIYYDEVKKSKEDNTDYPIKMPDGLR